jgi:hypothetical protein
VRKSVSIPITIETTAEHVAGHATLDSCASIAVACS